MKRAFLFVLVLLALAGLALAQQPVTPPPAEAPPAGKPQPQAKTQEEFDAFQQAGTVADLSEAEAAAVDYSAKFPQSELLTLLYQNLMHRYQQANNAEKTVAMGRKVLEVEPDNPTAAVTVATILAERTRETDLDREERLAEAGRLARAAIDNIDTGLVIPPGTPLERIEMAKQTLLSMAHGALGTIQMQRENHAGAEEHLRAAIGFDKAQPDSVLFLRLSVTLDHLRKYEEALQAAERSLELAGDGPVASLARQQRERLSKLAAGGAEQAPAQPPPPTSPQPQTVPPPR